MLNLVACFDPMAADGGWEENNRSSVPILAGIAGAKPGDSELGRRFSPELRGLWTDETTGALRRGTQGSRS